MHVITRSRLKAFWEQHPDAESSLRAWHQNVSRVHWANFADVRRDYPSADQVGSLTVFDIRGNNYRLIGRISYRRHMVFILHVLTHREYDRGNWKED